MRFEVPQFDDDDADLPADLAEAALQLSADAQWLSSVYPAAHGEVVPAAPFVTSQPAVRPRRTYRWAAAAVVLLALGVGAVAYRANTGDVPREINVAQVTEPAAVSREPAADPVVMPAVVFGELSGAEQEAVLDLLEGQASRLSI